MPKILRQRPFSWLIGVTLYLLIAWPIAWLQGQGNPAQETPPAAPAPPAKLPPVPDSGLGPEISVPPMKPGNVTRPPRNRIDQSDEDVRRKSAGCVECHTTTDAHTMH